MKVLTIQSIETLDHQTQLDINAIFRMEHHTDYVFKSKEASQYSVTISLSDSNEVIESIIKHSAEVPEYTFIIDNLDMEAKLIVRITFQNGKILEKRVGSWEWESGQ